ncbi:MAG: DNA repair protein RadA [candidate division WOR-3 bacterium]
MKLKSQFICQNCGAESPKWFGRCPDCGSWGSMVEEKVQVKKGKMTVAVSGAEPVDLNSVPYREGERKRTGFSELDLVLGGGLVKGSLILVGGDPGIGKSTLMLQLANCVGNQKPILYVTGEESAYQLKIRAERLSITSASIKILAETCLDNIIDWINKIEPELVIIDSIQTIYKAELVGAPGSVGQVRECGGELMRMAKQKCITTIIIGHVTKFGAIAGPKTLEHIVDTVLYFEGDQNQQYRLLRSVKNRFGSTNEIGVFEMTERGLVEVENPSSLFLSENEAPGTSTVSILEGSRALLVEVQALTSPTFFNFPQRVTTGIDIKRLNMLLAVLERRIGASIHNLDCFVNVVGGIKIAEPAADLGVLMAVFSSIKNKAISKKISFIGEVGLGGEIRPVVQTINRIREAEKLGFEQIFLSSKNLPREKTKIELVGVNTLQEAVNFVFG